MSLLVSNLWRYFMSNALLWKGRLVTPRPPHFFGLQPLSQAAWVLALSVNSDLARGKFVWLYEWLMTPGGSFKEQRKNVGTGKSSNTRFGDCDTATKGEGGIVQSKVALHAVYQGSKVSNLGVRYSLRPDQDRWKGILQFCIRKAQPSDKFCLLWCWWEGDKNFESLVDNQNQP